LVPGKGLVAEKGWLVSGKRLVGSWKRLGWVAGKKVGLPTVL